MPVVAGGCIAPPGLAAFLLILVPTDLDAPGPTTLAVVGVRRLASALGMAVWPALRRGGPVKPPMREDLSELAVGTLRSIRPAMREVLGEAFTGSLERAAGCLAAVGNDVNQRIFLVGRRPIDDVLHAMLGE